MEVMENIRLVLAARMKSRRKQLGLNQDELAEEAGLSDGTIKNVEIGNRWPSPETLEAIAKGLKCTAGELLNEEPASVLGLKPSRAIQMFLKIPDRVVELAQSLDDDDPFWDMVIKELEEEASSRAVNKKHT